MEYSKKLKETCKNIKPIKLSVTKLPDELLFKEQLLEKTEFLNVYGEPPISLRYYCVENDIFHIPKCPCCSNVVTFNKAYPNKGFVLYCSPKCSRSNKTVDKRVLEFLSDKEWLLQQRIALEKSKEQIAEELGCSVTPINKWLKKHEIPDVRYNESNAKSLVYLKDYSWMYNERANPASAAGAKSGEA